MNVARCLLQLALFCCLISAVCATGGDAELSSGAACAAGVGFVTAATVDRLKSKLGKRTA